MNTKYIASSVLKTSKCSRVRSTSENFVVFNPGDDIYLVHYRPRICPANPRFMCVSNVLYLRWVWIAYEMRINVFLNSWIFISSPLTRFNDKICFSSFSQSNRFVTTQWCVNQSKLSWPSSMFTLLLFNFALKISDKTCLANLNSL